MIMALRMAIDNPRIPAVNNQLIPPSAEVLSLEEILSSIVDALIGNLKN